MALYITSTAEQAMAARCLINARGFSQRSSRIAALRRDSSSVSLLHQDQRDDGSRQKQQERQQRRERPRFFPEKTRDRGGGGWGDRLEPRRQSLKVVRPTPEFNPFSTTKEFAALNLSPKLVSKLSEIDLTAPTQVQASAIPVLLEGHDAAMQSYTGSGKTLAYLLPILSKVGPLADGSFARTAGTIEAVIVVPSRELAMQIVREAEKLLGDENRKLVQQLIGGANMKRQAEALKKNKPMIIVGTPGRISEFSRAGKLHTHNCRFLVFDEADQVVKYRDDLKRILEHVGTRRSSSEERTDKRVERQTILVSATMPPALLKAAEEWAHKPLLVKASKETTTKEAAVAEAMKAPALEDEEDEASNEEAGAESRKQKTRGDDDVRGVRESLPPNLRHCYVVTTARDRVSTLRKCINALNTQSVLVFMNFARRLQDTMFKLQACGIDASTLHGEKGKLGRSKNLAAFKAQRLHVLLVTEVGARGIDAPECDLVVNLELPTDATHYAHRAGRTGRLGRGGTVLTVCEEREAFVVHRFAKQLGLHLDQCDVSGGDVVLMEEER